MVDYQDPKTIASEFSAYAFSVGLGITTQFTDLSLTAAVVKFWHVMNGVFM
jgi:hypothetical protein